ncbi:MAG: DNA primase [Alphaproteobacteria bacterium]|nr:DNA primase [Alphaproteobacteria bacterium]
MSFSAQFLDEIRDRVPLADVVGRRVQLKRRGREHLGLCPFHKEKTPSFTVNEDKGFYHCFGCGAHGDVINFEMQTGGLSFPEAVEKLAGLAGLAMPKPDPEAASRAREADRLVTLLEAAAKWAESELFGPRGAGPLDYLKGRGLDEATLRAFRVGFAPEGRGLMKKALTDQGFSEKEMIEAGLLVTVDPPKEPYERFRRRILFPITDRRGRIIAFGGRIFGEAEGLAKYVNSPETRLFNKGSVLYGFAAAREMARRRREVIVTEGYLDVLALHRAGLRNAVAPLGTALTENQIRELWRLAPEPVLCFDGDAAGARAATRAAERALPMLTAGHSLRFAAMPAGEDPASLLQGSGAEAMGRCLEQARPLADLLWDAGLGERPADTPERRAALERRLEEMVRRIRDRSVQAHYRSDFRARLWDRAKPAKNRRPVEEKLSTPPPDPLKKCQQILVAVVLNHPDLYDEVAERFGSLTFPLPDLDRLRQAIVEAFGARAELDSEALIRHLEGRGFSEALAPLQTSDFYAAAGAFVRPEAPSEQALDGWEETLHRLHRAAREADLQAAKQAMADELTEEAWQRMKVHKRSDESAAEDLAGGKAATRD